MFCTKQLVRKFVKTRKLSYSKIPKKEKSYEHHSFQTVKFNVMDYRIVYPDNPFIFVADQAFF